MTEPGTLTVYTRVKDANTATSSCLSSTATWSNVAPTASAVTGSANEGSTVTLTANVTDP